jgi:redox-sensing transcriptional repressor
VKEVEERNISQAVIRRLPRYYRYLGDLLENEVERISSNDLSKRMNVTASQIRQDLNNFGGFGQQGYGYNVKYLHTEIGKILGLDNRHNFVIVGAGNLGQALANYVSFEKRGFVVKGLFDVNPRLEGMTIRGIPIRPMDELKDFIKNNDIEIAVLTIPKDKAIEVADTLADTEIKGIWNFAHTDLKLPKHIIVENVHLSDSLMSLSYRIGHQGEKLPEE